LPTASVLEKVKGFDFLTVFLYDIHMADNDDFIEMYVVLCRTITKPDRLKILQTIGRKKVNVSTLQKIINLPMSNLSNHLNDLYRSGILGKEKKGNFVYYFLTEPKLLKAIAQMEDIFKTIANRRGTVED
jgi:DNA-binding transcriptional ArsR family regulator